MVSIPAKSKVEIWWGATKRLEIYWEKLGRWTYWKIYISFNGNECRKRSFDGSKCYSWWMAVLEADRTCRASFFEIMTAELHPSCCELISRRLLNKSLPTHFLPSPTPPPKAVLNFCSFCPRNISWIYSPFQQMLLLLMQYFLTLLIGFLSFPLSHFQQNLQDQTSMNGSPMSYKK